MIEIGPFQVGFVLYRRDGRAEDPLQTWDRASPLQHVSHRRAIEERLR